MSTSISDIVSETLRSDCKYYKAVAAVKRRGKIVRRSHYRNYGRNVPGGVSLRDRMLENISTSNVLLNKLCEKSTRKV